MEYFHLTIPQKNQYVADFTTEDIPIMTFNTIDDFDRYAEKFAQKKMEIIDQPMYHFVVVQIGNRRDLY